MADDFNFDYDFDAQVSREIEERIGLTSASVSAPMPSGISSKAKSSRSWAKSVLIFALLIGLSGVAWFTFQASNSNTSSVTASSSPIPSALPTEVQMNLYAPPEDLKQAIDTARESTVTVYCGTAAGSGWFVDLSDNKSTTVDDEFQFEIITNWHVIDECTAGGEIVFTTFGSDTVIPAKLYKFDERQDLAILMTDHAAPSLPIASTINRPQVGHWVMAVGSPGGSPDVQGGTINLNGTVTTGTITNIDNYVLVTDAAINHGNSGGPLLNSNGEVVGVNSWGEDFATHDNIGYSQAIPAACATLIDCTSVLWNWK